MDSLLLCWDALTQPALCWAAPREGSPSACCPATQQKSLGSSRGSDSWRTFSWSRTWQTSISSLILHCATRQDTPVSEILKALEKQLSASQELMFPRSDLLGRLALTRTPRPSPSDPELQMTSSVCLWFGFSGQRCKWPFLPTMVSTPAFLLKLQGK